MTPLFKKLNYKLPAAILVLNAPLSFSEEMMAMEAVTKVHSKVAGLKQIDFAIIFVIKQVEIEKAITAVEERLAEDAVLWFCYPKGSSKKYTCDFNRDNGWASLGKLNYEAVRMVAIDEDWSALRFRKTTFIKSITRSKNFALSNEGKRRADK